MPAKLAAAIGLLFLSTTAHAEMLEMRGTTSAGAACTVTVNRSADGSVTAADSGAVASSSSSSSGSVASSTSAGGTSVHAQAGNGTVSSSSSIGGRNAGSSSLTVNGCTVHPHQR